jgi:hypothetical protein
MWMCIPHHPSAVQKQQQQHHHRQRQRQKKKSRRKLKKKKQRQEQEKEQEQEQTRQSPLNQHRRQRRQLPDAPTVPVWGRKVRWMQRGEKKKTRHRLMMREKWQKTRGVVVADPWYCHALMHNQHEMRISNEDVMQMQCNQTEKASVAMEITAPVDRRPTVASFYLTPPSVV